MRGRGRVGGMEREKGNYCGNNLNYYINNLYLKVNEFSLRIYLNAWVNVEQSVTTISPISQ